MYAERLSPFSFPIQIHAGLGTGDPKGESGMSSEPEELFTSDGEELSDFVSADFGNQSDWSKADLKGKALIVRGLSQDTFESDFGTARSIKYNVLEDDPNPDAPWGMLFSDTSPIINQVRRHIKNGGKLPFVAIFDEVKSTQHKGQTYWILTPRKKG